MSKAERIFDLEQHQQNHAQRIYALEQHVMKLLSDAREKQSAIGALLEERRINEVQREEKKQTVSTVPPRRRERFEI